MPTLVSFKGLEYYLINKMRSFGGFLRDIVVQDMNISV